MAKKITVQNIIDTNHALNLYANYARRNMKSVPVEQFSSQIDEMRKNMEKMQQDFMSCDITELTPDMSCERRELEAVDYTIKQYKKYIEDDKKAITNCNSKDSEWGDDLESLEAELESDEWYLKEYKAKRKE